MSLTQRGGTLRNNYILLYWGEEGAAPVNGDGLPGFALEDLVSVLAPHHV